ncbi:hypothetical protein ACP26L_13495 [Paenibacillus sp. S-38]|uniref:hypothetical protein n=1 Tax=Paenibacillus sp. S-38 TaxID=3416710 RepID=UPI003CEEE6FB
MEHKPEKHLEDAAEHPQQEAAPQPAVVWESSGSSAVEPAAPDRGQVSDLDAYRERKEAAAPAREAAVTRWALPGQQKEGAAQWLIMVSSGFGTVSPHVIRSGQGGSGEIKACLAA